MRIEKRRCMQTSRRAFLKAGAATTLTASFNHMPLLASVSQPFPARTSEDSKAQVLDTGWEYYEGSLDPRFQVWHSEELIAWEEVTLPHCFNHYDACDPDVPAYRGPGWYRTKLQVSNPFPNGRTLLHFEAAGQRARIYVGPEEVAHHAGGYDEFLVDITGACRSFRTGEPVHLAVLCDNSRDIDALPSDLSDFTIYGGLYRPVHLLYVPSNSLEAVHTHVQFEPGTSAQVRVTARLYAPGATSKKLILQTLITSPEGEVVYSATAEHEPWSGEGEIASFEVKQPSLWSPDSPALYRCDVKVIDPDATSATSHRFGIRHARFQEHGPFYLNGSRLLLRGTHRHEDHAGCAAAMSSDQIRREMTMIKEMGANFIRLAHYQQRRLVLDLCDELGILVWEELPWCRSGVGSSAFQEQGRTLLRTMIDQHRNHPSILCWGLGNEDDWPTELNGQNHAAIRQYMQELRDLSHSLDPDRPTSYRRCEFARDIPDVYSPSIWAGWYSGRYTEYAAALEEARASVPHFIHMEWGADSHAGRHAEDPDPAIQHVDLGESPAEQGFDYKLSNGPTRMAKDGAWTETYACDLFDWYLKTIEETPWLTGAAQWAFKDFTTPLRVDNPIPRVNQKGLVQRDLTPKEGYFVFQSYWAKKPMIHIYGHSWPIRWGRPGQHRTVRVYSNCNEVELFLNGTSAGVKRRNPKEFPACGFRWQLAFREGLNQLRAEAHGGSLELVDELSFTYQTKAWSQPACLVLTRTRTAGKTVTVEARMLDADGVLCLDSRAVVSFSLAGEGRLLDNRGTTTGSKTLQLYNGRAEISLVQDGPLEACVTSHGIQPAFLTVPSN